MNDYINNSDNNSSNGNNGNKGKFSDRLKKMRRDRLRKKKYGFISEDEEENVIIRFGRNIAKIALVIPSVVYTTIKDDKNKTKLSDESLGIDTEIVSDNLLLEKRLKVNKIREIDGSLLRQKRKIALKSVSVSNIDLKNITNLRGNVFSKNENSVLSSVETDVKISQLQKEIIDLIKKKLVKNINELEMLQSELYLLKEVNGEDLYLKECQENIKEIKKLLTKVKSLKEKYDNLKDNVDFEYILEYGDDLLIDKIIELKELCSREDIKYVIDNYKLLDEYKFLYLKIDKLEENAIKYEDYKNEKAEELKERDINFEDLKKQVYNADKDKERYERFVLEQESFLKNLEDKISQIDSHEKISYKLKGFNKLLGNSFKYLGLLLLNPLKGLMPGIVTQTLVTKNLIHNLYNNLEWEENKKMVYEAIDYSASINIALNNLDETASLVNSTLDDVLKLKAKYIEKFEKYQYSFPNYRDMISKINKMENAILGSQIKIENLKQKMKEKEKLNSEKMKKVKKLTEQQNK